MIITIFGIIVFHLMKRIAINRKKPEGVKEYVDMLGFSYLAIPSRHEVPWKLCL